MQRVFIFGDSNSWGYLDDGSGNRYSNRWPVQAAQHLSRQMPVEIIEDCLPGRTTNLPDPVMGPEFDGSSILSASVKSHQPLDLVLIMLGTNDLKHRFGRDEEDIASALAALVGIVKQSGAGAGGWHAQMPPKIAVICPPTLGTRVSDSSWLRYDEWRGGFVTSQKLPDAVARICDTENVNFIDANKAASSSSRDPIHWAAEIHHQFGEFMATQIVQLLSDG